MVCPGDENQKQADPASNARWEGWKVLVFPGYQGSSPDNNEVNLPGRYSHATLGCTSVYGRKVY